MCSKFLCKDTNETGLGPVPAFHSNLYLLKGPVSQDFSVNLGDFDVGGLLLVICRELVLGVVAVFTSCCSLCSLKDILFIYCECICVGMGEVRGNLKSWPFPPTV